MRPIPRAPLALALAQTCPVPGDIEANARASAAPSEGSTFTSAPAPWTTAFYELDPSALRSYRTD